MVVRNICSGVFIGILCVIFCSCQSVPVHKGSGDLCGFVIDENNQPVENFIVTCIDKGFTEKTEITNERGLFIFSDMNFGKLELSGSKTGYGKYEDKDFIFYEKDNILCIQVNSADAILDKVEKQILAENYKKANAELNDICCKNSSVLRKVISKYRKVIGERKNETAL